MLYKITIAPADDSGATATVVVDTADDASRITDVHLHSARGLTNGRLPEIDFDLLLAAFTPAASAPSAVASKVSGVPVEVEVGAAPFEVTADADSDGQGDRTSPDGVVAAEPAVSVPPAGRSRRRTARSRQAGTAAAPAAPGRRKRTAATSSSDTRATDVPAETRAGSRQYRRMPADLGEVYRTAGSVRAVAEHYQVPRHTAQGWIGRLNRGARQGAQA